MVSLGALLAPLNSTMIAVALPEIRNDFGLANSTVSWLIASYLIAMAVVQPAAGRLGDELGRLRVFRFALVAFLVFSLAAIASPNFLLLVLFRTLQALAGAVLIPNGIGILRASVPAHRFGTYGGFNSAVIGSTAALGPLLGAAIIVFAPWRMLFLANVPFVLAALLLTTRVTDDQRRSPTRSAGIDPAGFVLFAFVLASATWAFGSMRGGNADTAALTGILAVAATFIFAGHQSWTRSPVASWSLFRNRSFVGASVHILLMNLVMYTTLLAIPFFIIDFQDRSATSAGLLIGAMAALQAVSAPLAGRISDSIGRRLPTLFSSVVAVVAALLLLLGLNENTSFWYIAVAVTVLGVGVGVGFVTAAAAATESVGIALSGSAAGTQSMMRYVGSIVGTGVLTGLLANGAEDIDTTTFRVLFLIVASFAALSIVAAMAIRPFSHVLNEPL